MARMSPNPRAITYSCWNPGLRHWSRIWLWGPEDEFCAPLSAYQGLNSALGAAGDKSQTPEPHHVGCCVYSCPRMHRHSDGTVSLIVILCGCLITAGEAEPDTDIFVFGLGSIVVVLPVFSEATRPLESWESWEFRRDTCWSPGPQKDTRRPSMPRSLHGYSLSAPQVKVTF